jgi:hypothetical protein
MLIFHTVGSFLLFFSIVSHFPPMTIENLPVLFRRRASYSGQKTKQGA